MGEGMIVNVNENESQLVSFAVERGICTKFSSENESNKPHKIIYCDKYSKETNF